MVLSVTVCSQVSRRCSDATGLSSQQPATPLPFINRRKSELPPRVPREFAEAVAEIEAEQSMEAALQARRDEGIVCSNTDLVHLLMKEPGGDINKLLEATGEDAGCVAPDSAPGGATPPPVGAGSASTTVITVESGLLGGPVVGAGSGRRASAIVQPPQPRTPPTAAVMRGGRLAGRSNSMDVGSTAAVWLPGRQPPAAKLPAAKPPTPKPPAPKPPASVLVSLHGDRPQSSLLPAPAAVIVPPVVTKAAVKPAAKPNARAEPEGADCVVAEASTVPGSSLERRDSEKVLWDERSGSLVDAGVLGSAIEGFLTKDTGSSKKRGSSVHRATAQLSAWVTAVAVWSPRGTPAAGTPQDTPQPTPKDTPQPTPESTPRRRPKVVSCDAVCSTLKSLFVK